MKKFISSLAILLWFSPVYATHFFRNNASNINSGTLNPLRLDPSTVTMQGNSFVIPLSQAVQQVNQLATDTTTIQSNITSIPPRLYDLHAGTFGVKNIDTTIGGTASFDAMFATVGLRGVFSASTITASIYLMPGIYDLMGATIPAGVTLYCADNSSTVLRPTLNLGTFLTVYGVIKNCTIDAEGRPYVGKFINLSTGAVLDNVKVFNAYNFDQATVTSIFAVQGASGVKINATVDTFAGCAQDSICGGILTVVDSNEVSSYIISKRMLNAATVGKQYYYVQKSTNVIIDGDQQSMGERPFVTFGGNTRLDIRGKWRIQRALQGTIGAFYFRNLNAQISTGTVISAEISLEGPTNVPLIITQFDGSFASNVLIGPLVTNTTLFNNGQVTVPTALISIGANTFGTVISNTHVYGLPAFASDSGNGSLFTNMGNTLNNKAQ